MVEWSCCTTSTNNGDLCAIFTFSSMYITFTLRLNVYLGGNVDRSVEPERESSQDFSELLVPEEQNVVTQEFITVGTDTKMIDFLNSWLIMYQLPGELLGSHQTTHTRPRTPLTLRSSTIDSIILKMEKKIPLFQFVTYNSGRHEKLTK